MFFRKKIDNHFISFLEILKIFLSVKKFLFNRTKTFTLLTYRPEDGGDTFLRNADNKTTRRHNPEYHNIQIYLYVAYNLYSARLLDFAV
jgi:hypothetical protein